MKIVKLILGVASASLIFLPLVASAKNRFFDKSMCNNPHYYCHKVKRGETWARLFPNAGDREKVMRLNRTNIALRYQRMILVPHYLRDLDLIDLSPFAHKVNTSGRKLLLIDLKKHAFAAYNKHGYLVHWGPVSGGQNWCSDVGRPCRTVIGSFKIYRKQGPGCISSKFPLPDGGAKMPYCMHFYRGYALHGSQLPGYHASHGCVRLFADDAKWINHNFAPIGTKVIVVR